MREVWRELKKDRYREADYIIYKFFLNVKVIQNTPLYQ